MVVNTATAEEHNPVAHNAALARSPALTMSSASGWRPATGGAILLFTSAWQSEYVSARIQNVDDISFEKPNTTIPKQTTANVPNDRESLKTAYNTLAFKHV